MKIQRRDFLVLLALPLFFSACEKKISHEYQEIHWDRDMCDRCKMVVSERNHATQVIHEQTGKAYKFDDIGCAILWFKEENIPWQNSAKIWIADFKTAKWIDARKAFYTSNNTTPMAYGFAAYEHKENIPKEEEIIDFTEMTKRMSKFER